MPAEWCYLQHPKTNKKHIYIELYSSIRTAIRLARSAKHESRRAREKYGLFPQPRARSQKRARSANGGWYVLFWGGLRDGRTKKATHQQKQKTAIPHFTKRPLLGEIRTTVIYREAHKQSIVRVHNPLRFACLSCPFRLEFSRSDANIKHGTGTS